MAKEDSFTHLTFIRDSYCEKDQLGFDRYVNTLAEMIKDENFQTPFCIGIHGKWGTGKTSFMRLLQKSIEWQQGKQVPKPLPVPVWFNPWRYSKEEHLIIPFLKTIAAALTQYQKAKKHPSLQKSLKNAGVQISDAARAMAYGVKFNFFGLALSGKDMVEREGHLQKERKNDPTVATQELPDIYYSIIEYLKNAVDEEKFRLVVFIDDLDRCLPEKAVELLEAMKLFLDLQGYLFILGVDRKVVEEGIRSHYKYSSAEQDDSTKLQNGAELAAKYLEKMIQMPLELPPVEPSRKLEMIRGLLNKSSVNPHAKLVDYGIAGRPRDIIRFINFLAFFCRLAENLKTSIGVEDKSSTGQPDNWQELVASYFASEFYTKWAIFMFAFREQYEIVRNNNNVFFTLQNISRLVEQSPVERQEKKEVNLAPTIEVPPRLAKVLASGEPFANNIWLIRKYIHLADSVAKVITEKSGESATISSERAVITPGDDTFGEMVTVTKGPFIFGEENESINLEHDFEISIFPVTNKQFADFLNDKFHGEPEPMDEDHYRIINFKSSKISFDKTKGAQHFVVEENYDDHPVTGVTWFGAVAYCKWLTEKSDTVGEDYRLPTEHEWEKAARGDSGNQYPWGMEFDSSKCNTIESDNNGTTEVHKYPQGISPYGCYDMAGNVWEWINNSLLTDSESKMLKGGSWFYEHTAARCASSRLFTAGDWIDDYSGFRCAKTKK